MDKEAVNNDPGQTPENAASDAPEDAKALNELLDEVVTEVSSPSVNIESSPAITGSTGQGGDNPPLTPLGSQPDNATVQAKRGRGRPKKTENIQKPKLNGIEQNRTTEQFSTIPPVNTDIAGIEPCAQVCVSMIGMSGMMLGGEQAAMTQAEQALAKDGFVAYFKAKGIHNVPAWVLVLGAVSPYYTRIIATTPAKHTVSTLFGRMSFGIKEFFRKRKNARSNRRNDIQRENYTSDKTSETDSK